MSKQKKRAVRAKKSVSNIRGQMSLFNEVSFAFGPGFLHDHVGHVISDPRLAIVELIANAYDAGAQRVEITWPQDEPGRFEISDNGTGMSIEEFNRRWKTLCYNRMQEQGSDVVFPVDMRGRQRIAFGQSGKGRHGAFCFADTYWIETWKDGESSTVCVSRTRTGQEPFHCSLESTEKKDGHGTRIYADMKKHLITVEELREWIGSKFLVDPSFEITINGTRLELLALRGLSTHVVEAGENGGIKVHHIDGAQQDRTTQLRGITWWVNTRMVGQPSWDGLDERGAILDGRTVAAKRFSFVVEADILKEDVKDDWSGFRDSRRSLDVQEAVRKHVMTVLDALMAKSRKERKKAALAESQSALRELPHFSRKVIGHFVDEVQQNCPTLSEGDLVRTVQIFTRLEQARSGYELLEKLAKCSVDDLDTWNRPMHEWDAGTAEIILCELNKRLTLMKQLRELVNTDQTDELHDLQPLFARGLWIFGPEYEAVEFTSNRSMATTIRELLGGMDDSNCRLRADFVALPDRSIGVYSADSFNSDGEVDGVREVLIVELKKGGATIGVDEIHQGEGYARELRRRNAVDPQTKIDVYVLGTKVAEGEDSAIGANTKIMPRMYDIILKRAEARTFHLLRRIEESQPGAQTDEEVDEVLAEGLFAN
jgi:hypothetical protein